MANSLIYKPIFISKGDDEISPEIQERLNQSIVFSGYKIIPSEIQHQFIKKKDAIDIIEEILLVYLTPPDAPINANTDKDLIKKINSLLSSRNNNNSDIDLTTLPFYEKLLDLCKSLKILPDPAEFTLTDLKKWNKIQKDIKKQLNDYSRFIYKPEKRIPEFTWPMFLSLSENNDVIINKYNTILLSMDEAQKIIGYLQYSLNGETIKIDHIEVHPDFRGHRLCNKLIELLIDEYPDIKKFTLDNAGGLVGYKCYVSTFRKKDFQPSLSSGRMIETLNKRANNNNKNRSKKSNNMFYSNTINFEKLVS